MALGMRSGDRGDMTKPILLLDFRRVFLDARPVITARSSKEAIKKLHTMEGQIDELWVDYELGPADNITALLDYLGLRAKIGSKYPLKRIVVHGPSEGGWQLLSAKLGRLGYSVVRGTVRDTLG